MPNPRKAKISFNLEFEVRCGPAMPHKGDVSPNRQKFRQGATGII